MDTPIQIFANQAADGNSADILESIGRQLTVTAAGTFGGGTVKPQVSPDGGVTWTDAPGSPSLNAAGSVNFLVAKGYRVRLSFSGSAAPSLNAWLGFCDQG